MRMQARVLQERNLKVGRPSESNLTGKTHILIKILVNLSHFVIDNVIDSKSSGEIAFEFGMIIFLYKMFSIVTVK